MSLENCSRRVSYMTTMLESNSKRRDKLVIIAEILDIAKHGCTKTHIMFQANLSFTQLNQYLSILTKIGLLEITLLDEREIYKTTAKGLDFMERQYQIINLLNGEASSLSKTSIEIDLHVKHQTLRTTRNTFSSFFAIKHLDPK